MKASLSIAAGLLSIVAGCGSDVQTTGGGGSGVGGAAAGGSGTGASESGGGGSNFAGGGQGGTGGGHDYDLSECHSDADCPGGSCVDVNGGYRMCRYPVPEATQCEQPQFDACCTSADCDVEGDACYLGPLTPFCGGVKPLPANACGQDLCKSDADCDGGVCVPSGVVGNAVAMCVPAQCFGTTCGQEHLTSCVLVRDPCCNGPAGFFCIEEDGCRTSEDCADGYCDAGVCMPGGPTCPA